MNQLEKGAEKVAMGKIVRYGVKRGEIGSGEAEESRMRRRSTESRNEFQGWIQQLNRVQTLHSLDTCN